MSNSSQKIPVTRTLNALIFNRIQEIIDSLGVALPCVVTAVKGPMVAVSFQVQGVSLPQVTLPTAQSQYFRLPIQVGDKGLTIPGDVPLDGIDGTGVAGAVPYFRPGNLSGLMFMPISNTSWEDVGNIAVVQGPDGVTLQDIAKTATIKIVENTITLSAGGHTLVVGNDGVVIDGKVFASHEHSGVQSGGSNTGPVA